MINGKDLRAAMLTLLCKELQLPESNDCVLLIDVQSGNLPMVRHIIGIADLPTVLYVVEEEWHEVVPTLVWGSGFVPLADISSALLAHVSVVQ